MYCWNKGLPFMEGMCAIEFPEHSQPSLFNCWSLSLSLHVSLSLYMYLSLSLSLHVSLSLSTCISLSPSFSCLFFLLSHFLSLALSFQSSPAWFCYSFDSVPKELRADSPGLQGNTRSSIRILLPSKLNEQVCD